MGHLEDGAKALICGRWSGEQERGTFRRRIKGPPDHVLLFFSYDLSTIKHSDIKSELQNGLHTTFPISKKYFDGEFIGKKHFHFFFFILVDCI